MLESRFPMLLECFEIRSGSGGRGRYQGGDGARRSLRSLEPMEVMMLANHRRVPTYGLPAAAWWAALAGADQRRTKLPLASCDRVRAHSGDVFVVEAPGGGGFGPATDH